MPPSKEEKLYSFLLQAFNHDQLVRWISFKYPTVTRELAPNAAPTALASAIVNEAQKQGVIDARFFELLVAERPRLEAEIRALRKDWVDRWVDQPSHTAIILDRVLQWEELYKTCAEDRRHLIILVHGDRDQDLDLFLLRIKHFLNEKCTRHHRVVPVGRARDHSSAVTAEDWTRILCTASGYPNNDLALALTRATQASALLLVLEDAKGPLQDLGADDFAGLTDLFCEALHEAVAAARPVNPVRIIVPVEHGSDRRNVCRALDALTKRLKALPHFAVVRPKELGFPSLKEVREHVTAEFPGLDKAKWAQCEALYRRVKGQYRRTLRDLADPLDALLSAWMQERAAARQVTP